MADYRGYHDLGGQPAGPVVRDEHELAHWEKRVDAMTALMNVRGLVRTDESRRAIEGLGADLYGSVTYTERRLAAFANNLVLKGFITVDELARRMSEVEGRARRNNASGGES